MGHLLKRDLRPPIPQRLIKRALNQPEMSQAEIREKFMKGGKKKRQSHPEEILHLSIVNYLNKVYPHIFYHHSPNGGERVKKQGKNGKWYSPESARLKKLGCKAGCPDILLFHTKYWRGTQSDVLSHYSGLAIELKAPGKIKNVSPEQENFMNALRNADWLTGVYDDYDKCIKAIDNYLK